MMVKKMVKHLVVLPCALIKHKDNLVESERVLVIKNPDVCLWVPT